MEVKYSCIHPKLKIDEGTLTGGSNPYDLNCADTLILLDKMYLPVKVVDSNGEFKSDQRVIYFPITDMDVPKNVGQFNELIDIIHADLMCGKSVHVQCIGGHGRTGTVIACYVGKYRNVKNPVKWVREKYCEEAVESWKQIEFISTFTGTKPFISKTKFYAEEKRCVPMMGGKRYDDWWEQLIKEVDAIGK